MSVLARATRAAEGTGRVFKHADAYIDRVPTVRGYIVTEHIPTVVPVESVPYVQLPVSGKSRTGIGIVIGIIR